MSLRKYASNVDVDTALEKNPVGYFHYLLFLLCGMNFMSDALEVNLLSFLSSCASEEWNLSNTQQASITSVVFAGIIAGSMIWGSFADRFGRRIAFISSGTVIAIGGILTCLAPSFPYLLAFRGLVGFGIGGSNISFDLLAEYLPPNNRGSLLIFIEYFWTFGSMLVTGVAWLFLSKYGWRLLAGITVIPIIFTVIFSIFYLPESPRWHLLQGNYDEAKNVIEWAYVQNGVSLAQIFGDNIRIVDEKHINAGHKSAGYEANAASPLLSKDLSMVGDSNQSFKEHIESDLSYWNIILDKKIRKVTIPLWCVWTLFGFTYYGLILFVARVYSNNSSNGDDNAATCSFDYGSIFINSLSELIGTSFGVVLIDRIGRVNIQIVFYLLSGLFVAMVSVPNLSSGTIIAVAFVGRLCIMTASSSTWVLTPELYPTEYRTFGHAICVSMSKVGAFISPYIVVSTFSIPAVATILGIANALAVVSVYFLPDSTGLSLGKGRQNSVAMILSGSGDIPSGETTHLLHDQLNSHQEKPPKKGRDNIL
jgi:MFS family permease